MEEVAVTECTFLNSAHHSSDTPIVQMRKDTGKTLRSQSTNQLLSLTPSAC